MGPCRLSAARVGFVVVALFGSVTPGFCRERGPRVEVVCPAPPIPVSLDKRQVLVYELHVTNFDMAPLTLKRVEVFASPKDTVALSTQADAELSKEMIRVGKAMEMSGSSAEIKDARVIEPGARSIIYEWVDLQPGRPVPRSLRHRMVFSGGADSATEAVIDDLEVPVSHASVPTLGLPFNGGIWLAGNGPENHSDHRRTITAIDGDIHAAERFAIDWVKVGPNGDSHHDEATRNENWWGWSEPILAVADGEITEVVDGIPDNTPRVLPPVTLDTIAGNHVILRIAPDRYVTYAHLKNGSIKVRPHDHVHRGEALALLGNSGNSTAAHLHLQVTDRNAVLQAEGVPFLFERFTYLGRGADYELDKHLSVPWTESMPPGDAVIEVGPVKK